MGRTRLAAAAVAAALAGVAGGWIATAVPAGAAPSAPPTTPVVTITMPTPNLVEKTDTPTIEGKVQPTESQAQGGRITKVDIQMTSSAGNPSPQPFSTTAQPPSSGQQQTGQQQTEWTFSVPVPSSSRLAWNGPYKVTAVATESDSNNPNNTSPYQGPRSDPVNFAEGMPPQAPSGVSAAKDSDGSAVTVSWQANPEPDIVGYEVQRTSANGSDWSTVSPSSGVTDTNYRDTSVQRSTDYQYRLIAVRSGAQQGQTLRSSPSASASTVTPPISSLFGPGGSVTQLPQAVQANTDPVAGQVHPGPGPGGPVTGSPSAGGYGNLPYQGGQAVLNEPGTPGAQDPKGHSGGANIVRTALFVAAGLILLAIAAHLIRMRRALDDTLAPVGVDQWDRHTAGASETAQMTTVGSGRGSSDVTRATAAQRGGADRSDVTRVTAAQRRR
jgi:hypothetical protein